MFTRSVHRSEVTEDIHSTMLLEEEDGCGVEEEEEEPTTTRLR